MKVTLRRACAGTDCPNVRADDGVFSKIAGRPDASVAHTAIRPAARWPSQSAKALEASPASLLLPIDNKEVIDVFKKRN